MCVQALEALTASMRPQAPARSSFLPIKSPPPMAATVPHAGYLSFNAGAVIRGHAKLALWLSASV